MKVESVAMGNASLRPQDSGAQNVEQLRKDGNLAAEPSQDESKVPPEEVLSRIKDLTEGGMYSVRFEMDPKSANKIVIHLVDQTSGKLLRQIPPEDIFDSMKNLGDLRGVVVNTLS